MRIIKGSVLSGIQRHVPYILSVLVLVVAGIAFTPVKAHALSGPYRIRTADSASRCLDVTGVSQDNMALLQLYDCLPYQYNQQFNLFPVGTYAGGTGYNIRAAHSGKCLDVKDVSYSGGAPIQQYDCLGAYQTNQVFLKKVYGNVVRFQAVHSGLCIDYVGNYNGAAIVQSSYSCNQAFQAWTLQNWN